ncbi:tetratricopeptide repeat protein [Rossellomorea vietnamensis]|uniref:Tetratricopeptide repeat protein n=1 Tax=Rossellomorea aquimaris TaxID=189382 RepID=A0A5D4TWZ7_9BACI|nr:tetratricopeptide repeat protein [Rossellomorea aquimaris]TYS79292.1 tetratricopeptide repeat protein [Rossellomorea aquimaris]
MNYAEEMLTSLEQGDLDNAAKHFKRVKNLGTDEEKFTLAENLYHLGFMEETKELLELLLASYPGEGELIVTLAEVLVEMDDEEGALELLSEMGEGDPDYPRALLLQADLYQMQGLFEVSEQKLLQAKKILPAEPVIDFALGELYLEIGKFLEAIRSYENVLKAQKTNVGGVDVHQRMGEALSAGGDFEQALDHYEKALDEHLEINTLFGYAFTAYQAGYYTKAIEKLESVKALDPDYNSLYLLLSKAYEHEEELDKSLETVKEGITHDEFNKELLFHGGKISLKLGMEEDAEKFMRESLALDQGYMEAALTLNKLFLRQERYEDILEIIKLMESEGEEDPQLHWDAAAAYEKTEDYKEALKQYRLAYTFFKEHPDFLQEYGYFLIEEGKRGEAREVFNELVQKDPTNEEWAMMIERLEE